MFSNVVSAAAVVLGAARLASAQTFTNCNPLQKSCPPDPAFGGTYTIDFTKGASDLFTLESGTSLTYDANKGAVFTINQPGDAPTITSTKYLFFGRVDVVVQAAPGTGIVTSCVLQSDDLDEIDWEWLGGDTTQVQTNYFSKGDTSTYDRGGFSSVANPQSSFHTYTIDWTPQTLNWMIDGTVVRTLTYAAASGGATYPQTPMQLKLGTWDGGAPNEAPGTVQWAGGYTNFADAPFIGYYKSITVTDYSNGVSGASEYVYGDESGTYGSIKVITGSGTANTTNSQGSTSSSVASTTTKTTSSTRSTTSSTTTSTTMSSSTISISNSTLSTSSPTTTTAATTSTSSATAAPKNAAEKLGFSFANAALIVAGVFGYLVL